MTVSETALPLHGTRVLGLCHIVAGPTASLILADLGADMIKVDNPGRFLMNVIYVTKDMAETRPAAVRAFLKGWYEAVNFMFEHKAEASAIAQTVTHFAPSVQDKQYDLVMPSMSRDGTFPADAVATVEQSFTDLGLLTEKPDMTKYLTTRFLPQR